MIFCFSKTSFWIIIFLLELKYANLKVDDARKKSRDLGVVILGGLVDDKTGLIIGRAVISKFDHDTVSENGLSVLLSPC